MVKSSKDGGGDDDDNDIENEIEAAPEEDKDDGVLTCGNTSGMIHLGNAKRRLPTTNKAIPINAERTPAMV
jgi:hypothetical protein